jgi:hypothetical protein
VDEILFQVLAEQVARYLAAVDRLAGSQPPLVGTELRRLAAAWRALLRQHEPSGHRRHKCTGCDRRGAMCTTWRVAGAYFVRRLRT